MLTDSPRPVDPSLAGEVRASLLLLLLTLGPGVVLALALHVLAGALG